MSTSPVPPHLRPLFDFSRDPPQLGPFPILGFIAAGGMGFVCRAREPVLQREVALKVPHPDFAADETFRLRFLEEARALASVRHAHVVAVHSVGELVASNGCTLPYLVMEYLEGETLDKRLAREGSLPPAAVVRLGMQVACALQAIHERGLVHRDLKPLNLFLVGEERSIKILDFGLARALDQTHFTQAGDPAPGTGPYMAPEQIRQVEPVDARCDLFSLGCVLYKAGTGQLAFKDRGRLAPPAPPHQVNPGVPPALATLILSLLALDRNDRPPHARAVLEQLDRLANPSLPPARGAARAGRKRWLAAGFLLPLAAGILLLGLWRAGAFSSPTRHRDETRRDGPGPSPPMVSGPAARIERWFRVDLGGRLPKVAPEANLPADGLGPLKHELDEGAGVLSAKLAQEIDDDRQKSGFPRELAHYFVFVSNRFRAAVPPATVRWSARLKLRAVAYELEESEGVTRLVGQPAEDAGADQALLALGEKGQKADRARRRWLVLFLFPLDEEAYRKVRYEPFLAEVK